MNISSRHSYQTETLPSSLSGSWIRKQVVTPIAQLRQYMIHIHKSRIEIIKKEKKKNIGLYSDIWNGMVTVNHIISITNFPLFSKIVADII